MALERKPLEQAEGPGYPDAAEYATGRRAFLWFVGAAVAGAAGAAAELALEPQAPPRKAILPPARPPARPQSRTLGW